jgi:hypothetical protein
MYTQIEQVRAKVLEVLLKTEEKLHLRLIKNEPKYLDHGTIVKAKSMEHKHRIYHLMEKVA